MQVSVIITNYNYARYLARAIRSVFGQSISRDKFELILVDDASTDKSMDVIDSYKDLITVVRLKKNVGLAEARNIGIRRSKGMYVVFLDADDYMHSETLRMQETFLTENNRLNAVAVDYYLVNEFGDHESWASSEKDPIACGVMFRKDLLFDIGLYDKKFKAREEEDLRIRFLKKYSIFHIPLPLYRYRKHGANLTNNKATMKAYSKMLRQKHKL